jgi:hypothetical protein
MDVNDAPSLRESPAHCLNEALMLLSEGLDLCARARKLDDAMTRAIAAGGVGGLNRPMQGAGTRCLTPALWVQDAYETALADWEVRAKEALYRLTPFADHLPPPSGITALLQMAHVQASQEATLDGSSPKNTGPNPPPTLMDEGAGS